MGCEYPAKAHTIISVSLTCFLTRPFAKNTVLAVFGNSNLCSMTVLALENFHIQSKTILVEAIFLVNIYSKLQDIFYIVFGREQAYCSYSSNSLIPLPIYANKNSKYLKLKSHQI